MSSDDELRRQLERMRALSSVSHAFAENVGDVPGLVDSITRTCASLVGDLAAISLIDDTHPDHYFLAGVYHPEPALREAFRAVAAAGPTRRGEGMAGKIIQTGQPVLLATVRPEEMVARTAPEYRDAARLLVVYSFCGLPLRVRGTVIGAITMARSRPDAPYTLADITYLQDLADRAALAIENARLYHGLERRVGLATAELRAARDDALAAAKARTAFLANMSHEIRTPMNAIIGLTSILLDGPLDASQRDVVEVIRGSGEHLLSVINDILDFSRFEAGHLDIVTEPFDVRRCVDDAIGLVAHAARAKQLDLAFVCAAAVPQVIRSDANRLKQVLLNLLSNAVKFTQRGEVVVEAAMHPGIVDRVAFRVSDTGVGMTAAQLDKLFVPFAQVSQRREVGSTGLGLAISKTLVEALGGAIDVESTVGLGTTFAFSFVAPAVEPPHVPPLWAGIRLVVAGTHARYRALVARQVVEWGFEVRDAASAAEAIAAASEPATRVLVVVQSPELDPAAVVAAVRVARPASELAIAVVWDDEAPRGELDGQIQIALAKPVRQSRLFDGLMVALGERASAAAASAREVAPLAPLAILLVEDNAVNQRVALAMLRKLGQAADIADNGASAVRAVAAKRYDVVLMDIHMPELDGYAATRQIRKELAAEQQPRIVALTASAMYEDREACVAAGMDDFITKPLQLEALAKALQRARPR